MSSTPISFGPSPFLVLAAIAKSTAELTQQTQLANISQDLSDQLNRQIAALQPPVDQVSVNLSQAHISALQKQQATISKFETLFGNNGSLFADMTNQLNLMSQAITNGDATGFDNYLSALNTDISDVTPPEWNPLFQSDGASTLKASGVNIQSSASYDLSTPAGQAAATADVTTAQNLIQGILAVNGANQTVAASELTALNGKITALQNLQFQQQASASQEVQKETQRLQANMQNQLHLIELNLGQASQAGNMLSLAANPPQKVTSVFGALANAIGENGATAETQLGQTPAVLSLFA
jgi:hypothetical protein